MPKKILVVDDGPDVESLFRQIFSKKIDSNEVEFLFATDGVEALESVRVETELVLVFTNINIQGMDGLTLLSKIKELNPCLTTSIIMSAYNDMDNIRTAMHYGAFDFITKPLNIRDVEISVEKGLHQVEKIRQNIRLREERDAAFMHSQAKSRFLSTMSHEIRTRVSTVLGMTELLRETNLDAEQHQYIQVLDTAGETLLDIVTNILDLSKIEAGRLELEHIDFDLRNFLQNIVCMMTARCDEKDIRLTADVSPIVPEYLRGDPARLRQVLINLVGNAIKFTKSGEIKLEVEPAPGSTHTDELLFCISDTGIGIPHDKLDKVFETFSQAHPSIARHYGGTGLGLAICKNLVAAMNGRIWVKSQLGVGSKFYFTVVIEPGLKSATLTTTQADDQEYDPRQMPVELRVLLVDDSEQNQMIIKHHLQPFCQRIDCTDSGKGACDLFKANAYDLVLMDIQMPEMDGRVATQIMRQWESDNNRYQTPIIGLTAYAMKDEIQTILDSGCTETLIKPLRKSKLINIINKFCIPQNRGLKERALKESGIGTIHIPSIMQGLVQQYLGDIKKEVQHCFNRLESNDFEVIEVFGHRLKGSGGAYGFDQLTQLGAVIEQLAAKRRSVATYEMVRELQRYLDSICVIYD